MSRTALQQTGLSCGQCGHHPLIRNPAIPHWHHCPVCDPAWSEWITSLHNQAAARPELLAVGLPARH